MQTTKFDGLMVKLASEEIIEKWSHGSIDHADTINYRTGKPKPKGLFCEAIFGPEKNYECSCGKYKGVRYKGIVCERCGVEVTNSRVRRERMGHIDLASPVVHIRYQKSISGGVHHLLGISGNEIQKILSFVKYIIVDEVSEDTIGEVLDSLQKDFNLKIEELDNLYKEEKQDYEKEKQKKAVFDDLEKRYVDNKKAIEQDFTNIKGIVSEFRIGYTILESDYRNIFHKFGDKVSFQSGPDAIYYLLKKFDVRKEIKKHLAIFAKIKSAEQKKKAFMLIKLLINLYISGVHPKNMVIRKLPVIPPALRPVVQLDGGKFASSDVNLFYRRVLMRNIRLKKMIQAGMPDVVKKNEIRLLQESVNNLFVGEKNNAVGSGAGNKLFKSISDMLSGKEGIFRKNLLGKRVDYSGRSVITVGPNLRLNECGVPLYIAMKMFTPFVIGKLIEKNIVYTPKQAEKIIKEESPLALKLLEEVIKDKRVLLNRAPTLHRLSIEAFKIKLMPGKTIRLHPLVCPSFNADFDGDQMAIHLPISDDAQREARNLIAADKNILKPASGEPTIAHSQDMVLGIYYLTDTQTFSDKDKIVGYFNSFEDVISSYSLGNVGIKDQILVKNNSKEIITTVGRILFNNILPEGYGFINETVGNKPLKKLISAIFDEYGQEEAVRVADAIKDLGFKYSAISSLTINVLDMATPKKLFTFLKGGDDKANHVYTLFYKGLLSEEEKHRLIVEIWTNVKNEVETGVKESMKPGDDLFTMVDSGARGSYGNTTQITGMKGLVLNPQGDIIELPIKGNYLDGLAAIEYFIAIHASRKGKADTALKTAESGYLTRKLCDACQEVFVREEDCGTDKYIIISKSETESKGEVFGNALYGRVIAEDIVDSKTLLIKKDSLIGRNEVQMLIDLGLEFVKIRSPLTCMCEKGVCQKCYGSDLATRKLVDLGSPIGIIAAQSIGEPATQLTLRTFHDGGGVASKGEDMTQGLDRVKQLFEIRLPKNPAIISPFDGRVLVLEEGKRKSLILESEYQKKHYFIKNGYSLVVKKDELLVKGGVYATKGKSKQQVKEEGVVLDIKDDSIVLGVKEVKKVLLSGLVPLKKNGETIYKGEVLTNGALDIKEYQSIIGDLATQKYIINGINDVYGSQGQRINNKHIELVVKQLFSKVAIKDAGESTFIPGTIVKYEEFEKTNKKLLSQGKKIAQGERLVLGLTSIAKETDSRLSAASFQETIRVMVDASLKGSIDQLDDLKSNVIIGRLLPLGEEYRNRFTDGKTSSK